VHILRVFHDGIARFSILAIIGTVGGIILMLIHDELGCLRSEDAFFSGRTAIS
jgi:hypothetical protein